MELKSAYRPIKALRVAKAARCRIWLDRCVPNRYCKAGDLYERHRRQKTLDSSNCVLESVLAIY